MHESESQKATIHNTVVNSLRSAPLFAVVRVGENGERAISNRVELTDELQILTLTEDAPWDALLWLERDNGEFQFKAEITGFNGHPPVAGSTISIALPRPVPEVSAMSEWREQMAR